MNELKDLDLYNKQILTENHYGTITLYEEGCLELQTNNITIEKLVNRKNINGHHPKVHPYDILVTSDDDVTITAKDLVYDVKVLILGADGIDGTNGKSATKPGENGEDGGDGRDGCDGAHVTFNYSNKSAISGIPYLDENSRGGFGGRGGNGGLGFVGIGESPICPNETHGGKNGNGGKAGTNGKNGILKPNTIKDDETRYKKPLNLSNDEEYNYFLENFGGEEYLKKYTRIWNSIQMARINKKTNENELSIIDQTRAQVISETNKQNNHDEKFNRFRFHVDCNVSLETYKQSSTLRNEQMAPYAVDVDIRVIDPGTSNTIHIINSTIYDHVTSIRGGFKSASYPAEQLFGKRWIMEERYNYHYNNRDEFVGPIKSELDLVQNPCFSHIIVSEPNFHAKNKKTNYIRFLYGRTINQNPTEYDGDSDYYGGPYLNNAMPHPEDPSHSYIPTTIIPIEGKIFFKKQSPYKIIDIKTIPYDTYHPKSELSYTTSTIIGKETYFTETLLQMDTINSVQKETGINLIDNHDINITLNDQDNKNQPSITFRLTLPKNPKAEKDYGEYDWRSAILNAEFTKKNYIQNQCELTGRLHFEVTYKNENHPDEKEHTYYLQPVIQSAYYEEAPVYSEHPAPFEGEEGNFTVYIPRIMISWGCYTADTMIKTTEGLKKACEIKKGDKLPAYGEKILTVSAVIIGDEKWICNIKTTDNKSIRVSSGHAMKLYCDNKPNGRRISACNIKKGDILMTPEGNVEVASVEKEAYNDKVYNFEFMENAVPNYIVANGFWSGDFVAQNEPEKRELTPEQKAICAEWKQLAAELIQKRKEESSST